MPSIHQFVPGFTAADAISNEVRVLREVFRSWGCDSEIFAQLRHTPVRHRDEVRDADAAAERCRTNDVLLLHLSVGSPVNKAFAALPGKKALLYHNVSPAHYFDAVNPNIAADLRQGREQVRALARTADVVLADSRFNARELVEFGYRDDIGVLPIVLDLAAVRGPLDERLAARLDDGLTNVVFVGRGVPNKAIDDVVRVFAVFQQHLQPRSRLIHVGSWRGTERYRDLVIALARTCGLRQVEFMGTCTQPELNAVYRRAHLFLSMSEHEGFCIPLLEAMALETPVLAHAAAAVPETLDGAGVLFGEKDHECVAEMMSRLTADTALRAAVLEGQRERLARYEARDLGAELHTHLAPLLSAPA